MTERSQTIARIRALRARASDAASSEAEIEAAARIAAKIIAEHSVTEAEIVERGISGIMEGEHNANRARQHPALDAAAAHIALLTECTALLRHGANLWIGQPEDVEFALYLCEIIQAASERAYKAHWQRRSPSAPSPLYRRSFLMGFGLGVSDRIRKIVIERQQVRRAEPATGTSLTVVKDALIADYMSETRPFIRKSRARPRKANASAMLQGQQAGNALTLTRPLGATEGANALAGEGGE